jgi:tetratricopeptide (TPR) repeat protein
MARQTALTALSLAFACVFAAPVQLLAQRGDGPESKRVVQKSSNFTLRVDDEPIERKGNAIEFYRVERTDGPSLWLKADSGRYAGWAPLDAVVPVEQAIDFFSRQIHEHPRNGFFFAMRGFLRQDRKELARALDDFNMAVHLDPHDAAFLTLRGTARSAGKDHGGALADFTEAIRLDPKSVPAYIGRGRAWRGSGKPDRAIADYSEAIWIDPLAIAAYHDRGLTWQSKNEYEKAIIDYNMVIRLDPQSAPAYTSRGIARTAIGSYEKALADLQEAIQLDPKAPEAWSARAWIWATSDNAQYRDGRRAVESATRACELTGWHSALCLSTLAAACAETGDYEAATKWQIKAGATEVDIKAKANGQMRLKLYQKKTPCRDRLP